MSGISRPDGPRGIQSWNEFTSCIDCLYRSCILQRLWTPRQQSGRLRPITRHWHIFYSTPDCSIRQGRKFLRIFREIRFFHPGQTGRYNMNEKWSWYTKRASHCPFSYINLTVRLIICYNGGEVLIYGGTQRWIEIEHSRRENEIFFFPPPSFCFSFARERFLKLNAKKFWGYWYWNKEFFLRVG